jgi:thiamine kinase-like enzyme
MLITKTQDRIRKLITNDTYWSNLLNKDSIRINGVLYKNWPLLQDKVYDYIKDNIINQSARYWQIIHGDLFFGNMLYDANSNTLKIIDPRGNFSLDGVYGDIRYDIAKLNHSILGKYDFIINGLYAITKETDNEFDYILYDSSRHEEINQMFKQYIEKYGYSYEQILVITGILFMSMLPLHAENVNDQKMFYLTAIKIFNMIF